MKTILLAIWRWFVLTIISPIEFNFKTKRLNEWRLQILRHTLAEEHCIILIRRKTHFTTWVISIAEFFLRCKFGYWSHSAINLENDVATPEDFRICEAIAKGVVVSKFEDVFNCESVALLQPKGLSAYDWERALWRAQSYVGKDYDTLFDFLHDNEMSCTELVRNSLKSIPNYEERFPKFEAMLKKYKKITPQMIYDDDEFEVIVEFRC